MMFLCFVCLCVCVCVCVCVSTPLRKELRVGTYSNGSSGPSNANTNTNTNGTAATKLLLRDAISSKDVLFSSRIGAPGCLVPEVKGPPQRKS